MLTKKQKNNPFYMIEKIEFQKLAFRHVGCEIINLNYMQDIIGYNDELKTLTLAKQSYDLGRDDYKLSLGLLYEKDNIEHVLVIALSFNKKFKKMVEEDPQMRVIPITIEDLLKKDYGNALPTIIAEMINKKPH